jgi:type IV pilus assembly protein PilE
MKKQTGFTLIELMIAVVIIGVLVSFAFTNYQRYVMKSNRAEAKTELLNTATRLQRCYTLYGRYNPDDGCAAYDALAGGAKITSEGRGFYEVDIEEESASSSSASSTPADEEAMTSYTLTATAVKPPQTNDIENPIDCTTLTLTHTGAKTPDGCW